MDVHMKQTVFHVVDESGQMQERGQVMTQIAELQSVVMRHLKFGEVKIAVESSTPAFWVRDVLVSAGATVEVTNPYKLRLIAESRRKTDANDAMILAELLRCNGLPTAVYVPETEIRELREQLGLRRHLIRMRTQIICAVKASFRKHGIPYTSRAFHTEASWEDHMDKTPASGVLKPLYQQIESERLKIEATLAKQWKATPQIQLLQTVPGVGPIVSYTIMAAVGDIHRFASADKVASYAGLVPSERSSGESIVRGGITHQGRSELCGAMVQAAWAVLHTRREEADGLKRLFYKIMFKRGSQVAIVAVARKLLTIAYHVLKEEKAFDGTRVGLQKTHHKQHSRSNSTMADAVDLVKVACGT